MQSPRFACHALTLVVVIGLATWIAAGCSAPPPTPAPPTPTLATPQERFDEYDSFIRMAALFLRRWIQGLGEHPASAGDAMATGVSIGGAIRELERVKPPSKSDLEQLGLDDYDFEGFHNWMLVTLTPCAQAGAVAWDMPATTLEEFMEFWPGCWDAIAYLEKEAPMLFACGDDSKLPSLCDK